MKIQVVVTKVDEGHQDHGPLKNATTAAQVNQAVAALGKFAVSATVTEANLRGLMQHIVLLQNRTDISTAETYIEASF